MMVIQWYHKKYQQPKEGKKREKKKRIQNKDSQLLSSHVSSLGACRHEADMAAGLLGLVINLGTYCPRKLGALGPSSHSDCAASHHGLGAPPFIALLVPHAV